MDPPPILTDDFLLTCIRFEYQKEKAKRGAIGAKSHIRIHQHICEMMLADVVRQDNTAKRHGSEDGSSELTNSETMSVDSTHEGSRRDSEASQVDGHDNTPIINGGTLERRHLRRDPNQTSTSSDGSSDRPVNQLQMQKPKTTDTHISPNDSDGEDDDDDEGRSRKSHLNYLKKGEEDVNVNIIQLDSLKGILKLMDEYKFDSRAPPTIMKIGRKLSDARRRVYMHLFLYRTHCYELSEQKRTSPFPPIPCNRIKSTIDYGKVKLHLCHSDAQKPPTPDDSEPCEKPTVEPNLKKVDLNEEPLAAIKFFEEVDEEDVVFRKRDYPKRTRLIELHFEHWEDPKGTWVWQQDSCRFFEGMKYDDLAATVFTESLAQTLPTSDRLEFDIEGKRTEWNRQEKDQPRCTDFYNKIKRIIGANRGKRLNVKRFHMKILKKQEKRDFPFKLRYMMPALSKIKISVWDDGVETELMNLDDMESFVKKSDETVWKSANYLDISDRNLTMLKPDVITFRNVKVCELHLDYVMNFINHFLVHPPKGIVTVRFGSLSPSIKEYFDFDSYGRTDFILPNHTMNLRMNIRPNLINFHPIVKRIVKRNFRV